MAKYSAKLPYAFSPTTGVLDFSSAPQGFDIRNLYAVVNISTGNTPLYLQGVQGSGAVIDPTGRILTLATSTAGMNATDILVFTYDDGTDNLAQLLTAATGVPDPSGSYRNTPGLITSPFRAEETLRYLFAAVRVLTRVTAADKNVNDTDLDAMLQDEIQSSSALF